MLRFRTCLAALAFMPAAMFATQAAAQQVTSWISRTGVDTHACTKAEPCRTFSGAYDKTDTGGTIRCLESGDFGGLVIGKSITVACQTEQGVADIESFTISTPNLQVVLKGLVFDGGTDALPPYAGVYIVAPSSVVIEDCIIRDMKYAPIPGAGISVENPSGTVELSIKNTRVTGSRGTGLRIKPTGAGAAKVTVSNSNFTDNGAGIQADASATTGQINLAVFDTVLDGNTNSGLAVVGGSGQIAAFAEGVRSVNNGSHGMRVANANAVLRVSDSVITGNVVGAEALNGGLIRSFGDNRIIGNNGNNGPLPPVITMQ